MLLTFFVGKLSVSDLIVILTLFPFLALSLRYLSSLSSQQSTLARMTWILRRNDQMLIGEKEEGQYQALVKELCKENKVKLGVQLLDLCLHCLQINSHHFGQNYETKYCLSESTCEIRYG